jgi:hypothetical protein
MKKIGLFFLSLLFIFWLPSRAQAAVADIAIDNNSITFSSSTFYSGDIVRIYARVRNLGDVDMQASVVFYNGSKVVGATQPVSLRVGGAPEEVFVDFLLPSTSFNIYAVLAGSVPADQNSSNDSAMTVLYATILDADKDGVLDDVDNCRDNANADQADLDNDGIGDACDSVDNTPKPVIVPPVTPLPTAVPVKTVAVAPAVTLAKTVIQNTEAQTPTTIANSIVDGASTGSAVAFANSELASDSTNAKAGIVWPDKAYGIFDNAVAAEAEPGNSTVSFWRLSNPVIQILVIVLGLLAIGCLLSVIVVRRRNARGSSVAVVNEENEREV